MNFFSIEKCGLYKFGSDIVRGCDAAETFKYISEWLNDRPFSTTVPWDPNIPRNGRPNCYCKDFYVDVLTGDYFFVLWKSTELGGKDELWGLPEDGNDEVVEIKSDSKGKKLVWGRPAYYWVVPSLNTVVSIKFDHSVCDSNMFEDWVASCINNRVDIDGKEKTRTESGRVRISFNDNGEIAKSIFRFQTRLRSLNTTDAKLEELAAKITHIVKRETVRVKFEDERNSWVRYFDRLPFVGGKPEKKSRQIEIRYEAKPSVAELHDIISMYAVEERAPDQWDNVGFLTDTGTMAWVNKYRLRDHIVVTDNVKVISAKRLFEVIGYGRQKYLVPILKHVEGCQKSTEEVA